MNIRLHKNATTTPARRLYIQTSPLSVAKLAVELGVTEDTIRRWKGRDSVADRSHTAHRLQTTLTPAQEAVVIALRKTLWLPLDDLLVVVREFIHEGMTRSALHRLLARNGVSRQPVEADARAQGVQDLRAGRQACRRQVSAADARRARAALPLRGDRPRHPLGVRRHQVQQERGFKRGPFCMPWTRPARSRSPGS